MIRLYGVHASRAAQSLWMCEELAQLGIPYEHVPVHFAVEAREPWFLALNPNGRIPALDDDGTVLFESMAINLYLAEKYAPGTLWPGAVEDHGRCYQWSVWVQTEIERLAIPMVINRTTLPEAERDEERARRAEAALAKPLGVLDGALDGRRFLLGDAFTVADLNVCSVVYVLPELGRIDYGPFPRLRGWIERCLRRPAMRRLEGR